MTNGNSSTPEPTWYATAHAALNRLARSGDSFTAFDLTEAGVGQPEHPSQWGALFREAHRDGVITPVGFLESQRPSRHKAIVRLWVGAIGKDTAA